MATAAYLRTLSITERYQSQEGMEYFLTQMGAHARERAHIIADGFDTLDTLMLCYQNNVKQFEAWLQSLNKTFATARNINDRIYFAPMEMSQLVGGLHYFNQSVNIFHRVPDLLLFGPHEAIEAHEHFNEMQLTIDNKDNTKSGDDIKLKGHSNYVKWRDNFRHVLSGTIGKRGIPIDYVIDDSERAAKRSNHNLIEVDTIDLNEENLYKTAATQFGVKYTHDNQTVFQLMKTELLGTAQYTHIQAFERAKNGASAWKRLREFYEGLDFQESMRSEAFSGIKNAFYNGETARHSFEKYIQVHQDAHMKLIECGYNGGLGMDEETKIQHLQDGIRESANLENALLQIRSNRQTYTNFTRLVTFLKSEVDAKQRRKSALKGNNPRRVSGVERNKRGGKGNKRGKGGGRNNNDSDVPSQVVGGKTVYARHYPSTEFRNLSQAQRDAVTKMRRKLKQDGGDSGGGGSTAKSIAALTTKLDSITESMSVMEERVISGVSRASAEDGDDLTEDEQSSSSRSKRSAQSGAVGGFFANKKRRGNNA